MLKISRRSFLAVGAAAVAAPPLFVGARAAAGSPQSTVAGFLKRQLPGLAVGEEDLHSFAERFLVPYQRDENRRLQGALLIMDNQWALPLLPNEVRVKYEWFARRVLTDFLFSTDFFTDAGRKPGRTQYVQFSDPYNLGCRNPLARFEA